MWPWLMQPCRCLLRHFLSEGAAIRLYIQQLLPIERSVRLAQDQMAFEHCCCILAGPFDSSMHCCRETVRLIKRLHQYDVMRANKAPFAFGLEPRVPFLDKEFLDISMTLDPADKMVSSFPDIPVRLV